ncbi:MAG: ornithine carbamoyltransferase [Candidatus Micrarchaeia archaeon]
MPNIISVADLSKEELLGLIQKAAEFKESFNTGKANALLQGKFVGLIFEKPSTRTKISFYVAAEKLGAHAVSLLASELQLGRGEPVKDTARMFPGWLDILVARVFKHEMLEELAKFSGLPVINALSDKEHPTQIISDLLTVQEFKKKLSELKIAFIGDTSNVANSLMLACAILGINFAIAYPEGYDPDRALLEKAKAFAKKSKSDLLLTHSTKEAVSEADVLYTDVWVSMGEEVEAEKRKRDFKGYQINKELLRFAKNDAIVMHCLPAHRGEEITEEVLEGPKSVVWQQGRNKLYGAASALAYAVKQH